MLQEFNQYSPLRVLDGEHDRALEPGQVGAVLAPAGTGKTSCLVQIGLDHLVRGRRVAHVALDLSVERVRGWYDEGLKELSQVWAPLAFTIENRIEMERRRHILSYQHSPFSAEHFARQLDLMASHQDFRPEVVIVDGFDFDTLSKGDLKALKSMVGERRACLWLAGRVPASTKVEVGRLPAPAAAFDALIDVALYIAVDDAGARLQVLRAPYDRTGHAAKIDPRTMLIHA